MKRFSGLWRIILAVVIFIGVPVFTLSQVQSNHILHSFEDEEHGLSVENLEMVKSNNESLLRSITSKTITISEDGLIAAIGGIGSYGTLISTADNQIAALQAQNFLTISMYDTPEIASIYLYKDGADYLVTAPAGVWRMDGFFDTDWQDDYQQFQNSRVVCYPRKCRTDSGSKATTDVVTFFYKLSPLSNQVDGVLMVNIYQSAIDSAINRYGGGQSGRVSIVDENGTVVSSPQSRDFQTDISKTDVFRRIKAGPASGYITEKLKGGSHIYTYVKSDYNNWVYIKDQPLDSLIARSKSLAGFWVMISNAVLLAGLLLTVLVIYKTYAPIRRFVRELIRSAGKSDTEDEYTLLTRTFQTMREQQALLHDQLSSQSKAREEMFLADVLRGNIDQYKNDIPESLRIDGHMFQVTLLSIDGDMQGFTSEEWSYLRLSLRKLVEKEIERCAPDGVTAYALLYEKTEVAVLVNLHDRSGAAQQTLVEIVGGLCRAVTRKLDVSVSAGIGGIHEGIEKVSVSVAEAQKALGRRMFEGDGHVHLWQPGADGPRRFFFPYDTAERIRLLLPEGNIGAVNAEIDRLVARMRGMPWLQAENVYSVFNQLAGAAIKRMIDNRTNLSDLPPEVGGIYADLAAATTIDRAGEVLKAFYRNICAYDQNERNKQTYFNRIAQYFKANYQHDINFEAVAEEVGISYSYLRKLIKDATDKTALEYLTEIRIDEARRLLLATDLTLREIAERVGFSNIQSFHRFFKKQLGVTAGEFRKAGVPK